MNTIKFVAVVAITSVSSVAFANDFVEAPTPLASEAQNVSPNHSPKVDPNKIVYTCCWLNSGQGHERCSTSGVPEGAPCACQEHMGWGCSGYNW
jgi:hypothetical protein